MGLIRRKKRDRAFSVLPTAAINDGRLGFKAKGVLLYILSKPDNWETRSEELREAGPDGRDAIRAALRELRGAGYMALRKERNAEGRIVSYYEVSEFADLSDAYLAPPADDGKTGDGKPVHGETATGDGKPVSLISIKSNNSNINIYDINKGGDDETADDGLAVEVGGTMIKPTILIKEKGNDKKTTAAAARLAALAAAVSSSRWDRLADRFPDPVYWAEILGKLVVYYSTKTKELNRLRSFYQLFNNWLKKEYVSAAASDFRAAYLDHVLRVSGVPYDFNNFDRSPDMIGINGLQTKISDHKAKISAVVGVSPSASEIVVFRAFLAALPNFWRCHRPASINRNFSGILDRIKPTTKTTAAGYSEFTAEDIQNIL